MGSLHSTIQWDSSLARTLGLKEVQECWNTFCWVLGVPPFHTENLLKHLKALSGSISGSLKNFRPELVENPTWVDSVKLMRPEVNSQSCGFEKTTVVAFYLAHSCNWVLYIIVLFSPSSKPTWHCLYCTLLPMPSIFPSIRVFSNESALCIRWPKYWNFSLSISPSNEYSGLISFRIDWFDLLIVQGSLKSLLQTTVQKHQFFHPQSSLWSNSHIHTWP